jgi:hypothetical protein
MKINEHRLGFVPPENPCRLRGFAITATAKEH